MLRIPRKPLVLIVSVALVLVPAPGVLASPAGTQELAPVLARIHGWIGAAIEAVGFVAGHDETSSQMDPNGAGAPVPTALEPDGTTSQTQSGETEAAPQMDPDG